MRQFEMVDHMRIDSARRALYPLGVTSNYNFPPCPVLMTPPKQFTTDKCSHN